MDGVAAADTAHLGGDVAGGAEPSALSSELLPVLGAGRGGARPRRLPPARSRRPPRAGRHDGEGGAAGGGVEPHRDGSRLPAAGGSSRAASRSGGCFGRQAGRPRHTRPRRHARRRAGCSRRRRRRRPTAPDWSLPRRAVQGRAGWCASCSPRCPGYDAAHAARRARQARARRRSRFRGGGERVASDGRRGGGGLHFMGFVLSCPSKPESAGCCAQRRRPRPPDDHRRSLPTACHAARELGLATKPLLVLEPRANGTDGNGDGSGRSPATRDRRHRRRSRRRPPPAAVLAAPPEQGAAKEAAPATPTPAPPSGPPPG